MLSVPPVMLELHRALRALQLGDQAGMRDALERGTSRCRKLDSELLWLFERCRAVTQLSLGQPHSSDARHALAALHERARRKDISGSALFCAFDEAVLFDSSANRSRELRETLAQDEGDRPNIWSLKLRALAAAGCVTEARAALQLVRPGDLAKLPCDRDYLGTLGALARVALQLQALDYAEALFALLAPYPQHFAVSISFFCEGSVSQLLGMLAHALGRRTQALEYLRDAVLISERAELDAQAEDARRELARCNASATHAPRPPA
jgi:tetratricopeptide (TPR) repeat protein